MPADTHPSKEIEAALRYARSEDWDVKKTSGHAWGRIKCPWNDGKCRGGLFCQQSIWSTPKVPEDIASKIRRTVDGCIHVKQRREDAEKAKNKGG